MKKLLIFIGAILATTFSQAQWEPDVRLTNDPGSSWTPLNNAWCIAVSGDTLHVMWFDNRDGNNEIYYKRSTNGGISWEPDVRLTTNSGKSARLCVALSGPFLHVVWTDDRDGNYEIYYKRSTDRGASWGADTRLTEYIGNSLNPSMAVTDSFLNILWYDNRDGYWEVYYKRSIDSGETWDPDVRLTYDPADAFNASIAVSGLIVHTVWVDYRDGNGEIYYKRSIDCGVSWGQDTRMTIDTAKSTRPCVATSGAVVHVVWFDKRDGDNEIYYKRSADGGTTWEADTRLTNSFGDSFDPSVAVSGSAVHIVWYDNRDGDLEIYYKRSEDEGLTWGADTRLTDALGDSQYPSIAVSGPMVHVVWTDLRDGNEEIYYKRNPTEGFAVGTDNESAGNSDQHISIYPNPAGKVLNIALHSASDENLALRIIDLSGRTVRIYHFNSSKGLNQYSIDLNDFCTGLYFIESATGSQKRSGKILICK
jgi:hypothetical protein